MRLSSFCAAGLVILSILPGLSPAQDAEIVGSQEKSVFIVRASTPPVIDGRLDDAVWQTASIVDDLHETEPVEYAVPSERTVFYLLYDDDALYVAAKLYDRDPSAIRARILRQGENVFADDWISVHIDPFHDRRSGYRFVTNPNGVRHEGIFQNINDTEWEWQGIWEAAAAIDDEGWTAEMSIPYKSISFDPNSDTWGINLRRGLARRDERMAWVSRNRETGPATAGIAVGFEGMQQGRGLDIVPSVSATDRKDFSVPTSESDLDPSLDVFYKITPSLTSALTINTDFSATEVDDRQVNLTRFGLFFPEKRDFFLQDADIFEFGSLEQNGRPFFSRSIGLSATGQPVDLEVGGKITGRVGPINIGTLVVRQDEFDTVRADNVAVVRASANIMRESSIGLIATEGDPGSNLDNSVQGIDFVYRNTNLPGLRTISVGAWAQQSDTEGAPGNDRAYGFRMEAPNEVGFRGSARLTHIEENFNPALGFINNAGIKETAGNLGYQWRPTTGYLRQVRTGANFERTEYLDSRAVQSMRRTLQLFEAESRQGDEFRLRHHWRDETLIEPFEISNGVVIPVGEYSFRDFDIRLETADHRTVWGTVHYRIGPFYGGDRVQTEVSVSWRPSGRFFGSVSYQANDIHLPQGNFITRLAQYRAEVVFSPTLSWITLIQYDNVSEVIGLHSRLHWIPEAGREAFLVFNHNVQDLDRDNRFNSIFADVAVKFSYTFRF